MVNKLILFALLLFFENSILALKPKDFFHVCKRNDPSLSKCTYNATIDKLPILITGIPELNFTPIDPFLVEKLEKKTEDLTFTLTYLNLTGGRFVELYDSFQVESDFSWMNYTCFSKQLVLDSDYKLERPGKPTKSGKAIFTLDNVDMNAFIGFEFYTKNGEEYLRCNNFIFVMRPSASKTYIAGISDDTSDETLASIFGNPDIFFGAMLSEGLSNEFKEYVNRVIPLHPSKDWFLK